MTAAIILIVEDDEVDRAGLVRLLPTDRYDVKQASTMAEAIAALGSPPLPDLVLLDLHLPGISGLDGLRTMKKLAPELRIIVWSDQADEWAQEALREGAAWVVAKGDKPTTRLQIDCIVALSRRDGAADVARQLGAQTRAIAAGALSIQNLVEQVSEIGNHLHMIPPTRAGIIELIRGLGTVEGRKTAKELGTGFVALAGAIAGAVVLLQTLLQQLGWIQ